MISKSYDKSNTSKYKYYRLHRISRHDFVNDARQRQPHSFTRHNTYFVFEWIILLFIHLFLFLFSVLHMCLCVQLYMIWHRSHLMYFSTLSVNAVFSELFSLLFFVHGGQWAHFHHFLGALLYFFLENKRNMM